MRYHTLTTDLIQQAGQQARYLGHSYVGSAHLLLALIQQPGMAGDGHIGAALAAEGIGSEIHNYRHKAGGSRSRCPPVPV